jgi:uncharacterized protein YggE
MERRITLLIAVLALVVAVGGIGILAWSAPQPAIVRAGGMSAGADSTQTGITVSGEGRVMAPPDVVVVNLGVETISATLEAALAKANEKMQAVLNALKTQGVDTKDIQTSFSVYPRYSEAKGTETPSIVGYQVTNQVTVKIRKIDNAGKVIDVALAAGANSVNGLSWTVEDNTKYASQARAAAVKDAMTKANELATAAGVKVGKIILLSEVSSPITPVFNAAPMKMEGVGGGVPVEAGQLEVTVSVTMQFEIVQ